MEYIKPKTSSHKTYLNLLISCSPLVKGFAAANHTCRPATLFVVVEVEKKQDGPNVVDRPPPTNGHEVHGPDCVKGKFRNRYKLNKTNRRERKKTHLIERFKTELNSLRLWFAIRFGGLQQRLQQQGNQFHDRHSAMGCYWRREWREENT